MGVHRPALQILILFQSNIYEVNVREYPPRFSESLLILLFGFFVLSGYNEAVKVI